jgi:hypothetical protein
MPGFERQLARYPQLDSRIGFAHQYRPIDPEDVPTVLAHYWQQLGHTYDPTNPTDAEAANAITTITGGNFRLIERLTQIARHDHQPAASHRTRSRPRRPTDARRRHPIGQILWRK